MPQQARLKLYRRQALTGFLSSYSVFVDGQEVGKIKRGRTQTFELPPGRHDVHLYVAQSTSRTLTLDLLPGQTARLECWPRFKPYEWQKSLDHLDDYIVLERGEDT